LDIGTNAMKKNVPASHDSWATRLRITKAGDDDPAPGRAAGKLHLIASISRLRECRRRPLEAGFTSPIPHDVIEHTTRGNLKFSACCC
jgi:hypothetical protein